MQNSSVFLAIVFSPVMAVLISLWIQARKERRQQQFGLLSALIASRHEAVMTEGVRALNMIDLVFHRHPTVRRLWHEYFDMLSNEGLNNPSGYQQRQKKNIEMITEMARVLGYGKAMTHLDVDRVYSPIGFQERLERNRALENELLRVLKATARLTVVPTEPQAGGQKQ